MRNVLIVGSQQPASIENFYRFGLQRLGLQVRVFEPYSHVARGFVSKIRQRLHDHTVYRRANTRLIAECTAIRPDIVWVFKGVEVLPDTVSAIKSLGCRVVNFNPDHPYIRTSWTHGGRNVVDAVCRYDLYFSYHRQLVEQLQPASVWLPFGFHLSNEDYESVSRVDEVCRACFVGTLDSHRAELVRRLATSGIPVDVFGPRNRHARRLAGTPRLNVHGLVFDLDFWRVLRSYRVQLNFLREHNCGSHNQRTFEVPAAGGILLTPDTQEQREFFDGGKEVYFYGSFDDMRAHLDTLLTLRQSSANDLRHASRQRSITDDYTYTRRAHDAYRAMCALLR